MPAPDLVDAGVDPGEQGERSGEHEKRYDEEADHVLIIPRSFDQLQSR